jgi:Rad3-related DNA helicase
MALRIWKHDVRYPDKLRSRDSIRRWIEQLPASKQKQKKITALYAAVTDAAPRFVVERTEDWFNGKGTRRGEPELRDCIRLHPVDITDAPPIFWPAEVEKVVLLSATIGPTDIRELGLDRRRVLYIEGKSPIPVDRRPVFIEPRISLTYDSIQTDAVQVARLIEETANAHPGEKGIIHATYQLAELLSTQLGGSRYMFHTTHNKREVFQQFVAAPPASGKILVASGMYEGVDLADDLARWQVIAKVPWKSLGDPAIAYKAEQDQDWYRWSTLRDLIQACGRVCRNERDYGVTYIYDDSVIRLLQDGDHLLPQWFREVLRYVD